MSTDVNVPEWKDAPDCEGLWVFEWTALYSFQGIDKWPLRSGVVYLHEPRPATPNQRWLQIPIPPLTTQEDHKS